MKGHGAFHRARAMMAVITAIIAATPGNFLAQRTALDALTPYKSRGKGGKHAHRPTGIAAVKRAAAKRRGVLRNRSAHRA